MESFVNISLWIAYILIVIGVISAVILPIVNSLSDPKSLIKPVIALLGVGVLYMICWAVAGESLNAKAVALGVNPSTSKAVGGALIAMYVLGGVAIIGIIYSEISKVFK
ncbi:MAG: hypothetical protein AAF519_16245 [Bacteroidota bacterium]